MSGFWVKTSHQYLFITAGHFDPVTDMDEECLRDPKQSSAYVYQHDNVHPSRRLLLPHKR